MIHVYIENELSMNVCDLGHWRAADLRTYFSDLDGDEENMVAALARTTRGPLDRDALSQRLEGSGRDLKGTQ